MKSLKYALCALICLVGIGNPSADAANKSKIDASKKVSLSKIQQKYKKTGSLEADFIQEVYQATLARTKTSKGNFKISKPNFVRWEIYEPEASLMVSNGRKLFYFTPDARGKGKGQVIERKGKDLEKQPLFQILSGLAPLEKEFQVEKIEKNAGLSTAETAEDSKKELTKEAEATSIKLKPRGSMGDLSFVTLRLDGRSQITEILLEHETGNKTKITLQNQTLGAKFPPELFEFKPPPETEVLKN